VAGTEFCHAQRVHGEKKTLSNTAQVLTGQGGKMCRFAHNGLGGFFLHYY